MPAALNAFGATSLRELQRVLPISDLDLATLQVQEAVYEGKFGTPKTAAGLRTLPLSAGAFTLLQSRRETAGLSQDELPGFSAHLLVMGS